MKKIFTTLLVALMVFSLTACKKKEEGPVYDYDYIDYLDIVYVGPNEFADLEISLKDFDSDDFESDTEYIKIKKFMTNLFPFITADNTENLSNGDVINIGINSEYERTDTDLNINLGVHTYQVQGLNEAIYLDLFDSNVVTFYGLTGTADVLYKMGDKSVLTQEVKDNLNYTITIDTEEVEEKSSIMSVKASLSDSFLRTTRYSDTETYFKSLGYIVDVESERALKNTVSNKAFEQITDTDIVKNQLEEKIKAQGDIDGYEYAEISNVQKTSKAYIYDIIVKYVNGEKVAYVEYESKLAYIDGEIRYLSFNKTRTVNERFATEALDDNELLYTFNSLIIEEETPVEETETTNEVEISE